MRAASATILGIALLLAPMREVRTQSYAFRHFGAEAGIDAATALAFDADGQLLVGTDDGLLRFDGRDVARVALPASHLVVLRLATGFDGAVWVLTQPARLFVMRASEPLREIIIPDTLHAAMAQARSSRRLRVDPSGRVWISDPDAGLWSVDPASATWRRSKALSNPTPIDFFFAGGDTVWLAMRDRVGTAVIDAGRIVRPVWHVTLRDIVFVRPRSSGGAWIGTEHGVFLAERSGSVRRILGADFGAWPHNEPATDSAGRLLLVGGYRHGALGLFELSPDGTPQISTPARPLLADHFLRQELFDPEHGFWVAHDGGISQLEQDHLVSYTVRSGEGIAESIRDLQEDPFGRGLWISTFGGVYRFHDERIERVSETIRRPASAAVLARDRSLWWTEDIDRGIVLSDGHRAAHSDRTPNVLFETAAGIRYSDTHSGLMRRAFGSVLPATLISPRHVTPALVAEGAGGRIWLSAGFRGVDAIDEDSLASECRGCTPPSVRRIIAALASVDMRAMRADSTGRVWIAGFGGLFCLWRNAGGEWSARTFGSNDGLLSDDVLSVAPAPGGRLWVGTARGLQGFSVGAGEPTLLATFELRGRDGLEGEGVTGVEEGRHGDLWFSSTPGLLYRLDDRAVPVLHSPSVRIASVEVNGVSRPATAAPVRIDAGVGTLAVQLSAHTLHRAAQVRLQYRLEPTDTGWTDLGADRALRFGALSPGNHVLETRAVRPGESPGPVTRLAIVAATPFYRLWWFPLLVAVVLGSLALWFDRLRMERRLALERLRTRIATDLHDDIGSGLTQISLYGELIRRESGARVGEWGDAVGAQARQLSEAMRDLVWAIDPSRESWEALELRMKDWAAELLAPTPIALDMSGTVDDEIPAVPAHVRRNLLLMFKETVHNAVRHAACRRIEVRWQLSRDALRLRIHDDGVGFDAHCATRGNGLRNIAHRAAEIGAALHVESANGNGTCVELDVPLKRKSLIGIGGSPRDYPSW